MVERREHGARRASGPLLSVLVLLAGLIATALSAAALYSAQRDIATREMNQRHEMALRTIRSETERYHRLLETLAAGLVNDPDLTWENWDTATAPLADARLIGAASVAFVVPVRTGQVEATQRLWRDRGATVTFQPDPDLAEHYFAVYLRYLDDTAAANPPSGDGAANALLADTLAKARDSRAMAVSDAYVLARDLRNVPPAQQQNSFILAVPVWGPGNTPRFHGWVTSSLRLRDLLSNILVKVTERRISGKLISVNADGSRHEVAGWAGPGSPDLHRSDLIRVGDRDWVLETHGDAGRLVGSGWALPVVVLAGGLVFTGLLAWQVQVLATGRARARARVEEATAELREAEGRSRRQAELLGAIMTTISDGVSVVGSRGELLLENPAARRLLGVSQRPEGPQDWQEHYGVFRPDGRTPFPLEEMPLIRALAGESTDGIEVVIRNPGHPEGILLSIDGRPLDPSAGEHGAVAVCRDVTELRRYETDLSIFAGVVAHDLKAPLSTVRGHAELVLEDVCEGWPQSAQIRDGLHRIVQSVDRMDALIETMLAYTTARHAPLRAVVVDPAAMVREVIDERTVGLGPDRPVPQWSIGPLPAARADPAMLRHVLDNLIGNALKYVRPGCAPRVEVCAGPALPGMVRIEVADCGIGIGDDDKPYIFETFHRTAAAAGYAGTGLGLTICQRIVARHGGEIGVADNPGGGTRFWFTLPAADFSEEPDMDSTDSTDSTAASDEDAVRAALERALAERAAMMEAASLPGLVVPPGPAPSDDSVPGRLRAPVPGRHHQRQD